MVSSTIRNPLLGTHSVLASQDRGVADGTVLGGRESPEWVPEYALAVLTYVCAVRRDKSRDTPRVFLSGPRFRRLRILRRMREEWCRLDSSSDSEMGEMALPRERARVGLADKGRECEDAAAAAAAMVSREGGVVLCVLARCDPVAGAPWRVYLLGLPTGVSAASCIPLASWFVSFVGTYGGPGIKVAFQEPLLPPPFRAWRRKYHR